MTEQQEISGSVPRRTRRDHLKPWEVHELCKLLAAGELSRAECARKMGVTSKAVTEFARRHKERIDEIRSHLDDEFAGLWAARKEARLAAYMDEYERLSQHPSANHHEWSRARQQALRSVAEELGQLPNRSQVTVGGKVEHVLVGVDVDDCFPDKADDDSEETAAESGQDPADYL